MFWREVIGTIEPQADGYVAQLVVELLQDGQSVALPLGFLEEHTEIGKRVFVTKCAACHEATSTRRQLGPGLKGIKDRKFLSGKEATDQALLEILNRGARGMPSFQGTLTDEQKDDVIAYMKTL